MRRVTRHGKHWVDRPKRPAERQRHGERNVGKRIEGKQWRNVAAHGYRRPKPWHSWMAERSFASSFSTEE